MDPRDTVARKRDGGALSEEEIRAFILGFADGRVSDELAASFLMACYIRGLDGDETAALTRAMVDSGRTIDLSDISRPTVDKHSTGGVADGVTLVFGPLAASLGLGVAKLSGRGLGHTGGTVDKLESIPGFRTDLSPEEFERQVDEVGCAIASQTADLVPADERLYALRDATATVASIPLIAASVMSKKLAVRSDLVLLDVKAGSGAFMKTVEEAQRLADACRDLGRTWERKIRAAVTDMSQPLGDAIGNALEVAEAVEVLRGERTGRLRDLTLDFAAAALAGTGGEGPDDARARAERAIATGEAAEAFRRVVERQGGDPRVVDDPEGVLPTAPVVRPIHTDRAGWVTAIDAQGVGRAAVELGAGRKQKGDPVDPAAGVLLHAKIGDRLESGAKIGEVHARSEEAAAAAALAVLGTLEIGEQAVEPPPLVYGWRES